MSMNIGEEKSAKLPIWLKALDFTHENNGLRLERFNGNLNLYVNDGSRRKRFCTMFLGRAADYKGFPFNAKVQSKNRMLFWVGKVRFVIDFAAKKVATNLMGFQIAGSKEWGDDVQMPWRAEFMPLFGDPMPPMEMDENAGKHFWQWFHLKEGSIVELVEKSRKDAKIVYKQFDLWLAPVFPFAKPGQIDVTLNCSNDGHTFTLHCGGNEKLFEDADKFAALMPEGLRRMWTFVAEE